MVNSFEVSRCRGLFLPGFRVCRCACLGLGTHNLLYWGLWFYGLLLWVFGGYSQGFRLYLLRPRSYRIPGFILHFLHLSSSLSVLLQE